MKRTVAISMVLFGAYTLGLANQSPKPIVVITDCYHPYQDPGDNLDLIQGFALSDVKLLGIVLGITDAFRKDTADHPTLWKDPRGPREAGTIPVQQLNYIFNRDVPFAVGPMTLMKSELDEMRDSPGFEQQGVNLLLHILRKSTEPIDVLSFGSARVLAVAFNREPDLLKEKIKRIHLSAGTASNNYELGNDKGANMIPGGEWNVALDVYAFTRILKSGLPIALYPCAGKDGGFVKDVNNSYYTLHDMSFLKRMQPKLQCYLDFAFSQSQRYDFLRYMDSGAPYAEGKQPQFERFHVWESAIWLTVLDRAVAKMPDHTYRLLTKDDVRPGDDLVEEGLRPCVFTEIRDDGRFQFTYSAHDSNVMIYYRANPDEHERAMNAVIPLLFESYVTNKH